MNTEERVSPMGMWRWGKDFIESAGIIQPAPQNELEEMQQRISIVAYYLLAHGIELQLKAFLLGKGYTDKKLRSFKKYGHDLEKLMSTTECNKIGEHVELTDYDRNIVYLLNSKYKEKELEYFFGGYCSLPKYSELSKLANKISDGLSDYIRRTVQ